MATVPYPPMGFSNIVSVMGGDAPHALTEYYRFGLYTPGLRNITVREPTSGDYYTIGSYAFDDVGANSTSVYWGGLIASGLPSGTSSYSSGGYTYYRGSYRETTGGGYVPFDYWYGIYRTYTDVVNINTSVPNIGATSIRISNFYGTEKP